MAENTENIPVSLATQDLASDADIGLFSRVTIAINQERNFPSWAATNVPDSQLEPILSLMFEELQTYNEVYDETIEECANRSVKCAPYSYDAGQTAAAVQGMEREKMSEIAGKIVRLRNAIGSIRALMWAAEKQERDRRKSGW